MESDPIAMLMLMRGGDATVADLDSDSESRDRFERLFGLRDAIAQANVDFMRGEAPQSRVDEQMRDILNHLRNHFSELVEDEDHDQAQEIIDSLINHPPSFEDLSERQIEAIHDTVVNVGMMRNLLYSYRIEMSDDFRYGPEMIEWLIRFRRFVVV